MNRIIRNITTLFIGFVVWTSWSNQSYAQCKVDNSDPVKGEFSINGSRVSVKNDGGGSLTASNNIPIKICDGETITLKNTLPVIGFTSTSYWILEQNAYTGNPAPIQSLLTSIAATYNTQGGQATIKMIDKGLDPDGISFYSSAPGTKYVIIQYDNTTTSSNGPGNHYACQVIEIIKPKAPVASVNVCTGSEFQVVIPPNANNDYDDYEVTFTPLVAPAGNVVKFTGKQPLPYTLKALMPDARDRVIEIKGVTATGGCITAPPSNLGTKSINPTPLNKPSIVSIAGTTTKAEFDIKLGTQTGVTWNFYRRDVADPLNYDGYTNFLLQQGSLSTTPTELVRVTVPNADKQYCFQAAAVDLVCGTKEISNEEICTTPAKVVAVPEKNTITWIKANEATIPGVNFTPFINYEVDLVNSDGTYITLLNTPDINTLTFDHLPVVCGTEYVYRVRSNYGSLSYSQIMKVNAISNTVPFKIPRFLATMTGDNKNVYLQGDFNDGNKPTDIKPNSYNYYRGNSLSSPFSLIKKDNSIYQDLTADVNKQQYCYYMTWTNLCNKESDPSDKVCTVFLKGSGATVNWTREKPHTLNTDSYIVQRVDFNTGTNIKELVSNLQGVYSYNTTSLPESEGQEIYIQIETRAVGWNTSDKNRLPNSLSNVIKIFRPSMMMSPQIFTPNGDNNNDKFMIRGKFIKSMKMTIYDRWGNAIFYDEQSSFPTEANQNDTTVVGWDGTMNNGNKALEGSYAFKIEVEDTLGQITYKEGALLLAY